MKAKDKKKKNGKKENRVTGWNSPLKGRRTSGRTSRMKKMPKRTVISITKKPKIRKNK